MYISMDRIITVHLKEIKVPLIITEAGFYFLRGFNQPIGALFISFLTATFAESSHFLNCLIIASVIYGWNKGKWGSLNNLMSSVKTGGEVFKLNPFHNSFILKPCSTPSKVKVRLTRLLSSLQIPHIKIFLLFKYFFSFSYKVREIFYNDVKVSSCRRQRQPWPRTRSDSMCQHLE